MQQFLSLKTVKNILFFSLHKNCKQLFYPVLWNKGLGVKRITFDRILLYWKVSVNNPRGVGWDLTDPPILENCILSRRGNCCSSFALRKSRLPQVSPAWGMAVSPEDCIEEGLRSVGQCCVVTCPAAGCVSGAQPCRVLRASPEHWALGLRGKMSEGPHLFVTSHRTRSWLQCCYCSVNINLKTYYVLFTWVCLKPDSFTNGLFLF